MVIYLIPNDSYKNNVFRYVAMKKNGVNVNFVHQIYASAYQIIA